MKTINNCYSLAKCPSLWQPGHKCRLLFEDCKGPSTTNQIDIVTRVSGTEHRKPVVFLVHLLPEARTTDYCSPPTWNLWSITQHPLVLWKHPEAFARPLNNTSGFPTKMMYHYMALQRLQWPSEGHRPPHTACLTLWRAVEVQWQVLPPMAP